ncbi:MAG: glycosyltransferase family 4 protein [Planctomycetota bacterium]
MGGERRLNSIGIIGTYPPRQCGIGTFTCDLCQAMKRVFQPGRVLVVALDDVPDGYAYSDEVTFQVRETQLQDYHLAANFLNINQIDAAVVQHEFGIFGGPSGAHILGLVRDLTMPVITNLHTVLKEPSDEQRAIMSELTGLSARVFIMSHKAREMLASVYGVPDDKICFVPHGIHGVPFIDPNFYKDRFGVEGREVILTFGLLSPNKGIEYMIRAMPEVVEEHPEAAYLVLGATHPHVLRTAGEEYRQRLQQMVRELDMEEHVFFHNRFVSIDELNQYIGAADIYVTPYLGREQITSGTLAYAVGAGKAVVSTPYWYAEEVLADGRGRLVPFRDSGALAAEVRDLLDRGQLRHSMRIRAYRFARDMVWENVAARYVDIARQATEERSRRPCPILSQTETSQTLPEPDLRQLVALTDDTGILQHAIYSVPHRKHGYTTDDNARALNAVALHWYLFGDDAVVPHIDRYLAFLVDAFDAKTGRFHNVLSYGRKWLDHVGSEDAHGRALWGLGLATANAPNRSILSLGVRLFNQGLTAVEKFTSLRAIAFTIIGIDAYLKHFGGDTIARRVRRTLANALWDRYQAVADDNWLWFEDKAVYANARLPHALILAGQAIPDDQMAAAGLQALNWLLEVQTGGDGCLSIIGNRGWFARGGAPASFDQQPLEAMGLVEACAAAYLSTRDDCWLDHARRCLDWFLGRNDLNVPLYDFETGGCCDGLMPDGPNKNQGAESTLAWLVSLLTLMKLTAVRNIADTVESEGDGSGEVEQPRTPAAEEIG